MNCLKPLTPLLSAKSCMNVGEGYSLLSYFIFSICGIDNFLTSDLELKGIRPLKDHFLAWPIFFFCSPNILNLNIYVLPRPAPNILTFTQTSTL